MNGIEKLMATFRRSLGLPGTANVSAAAYGKTEGWDSVAHMQLVAQIESDFGIMLDTDDVIGMSSFPAAVDILRRRHGLFLEP